MKQEDKQYEEWLTTLRNTSPVLQQPEELTDAIMGRIHSLPKKNKWYLLWGSWISGVAAIFLLLFLAWETEFPPLPGMANQDKPPMVRHPNEPSGLLSHTADYNLTKKSPQLFRQRQEENLRRMDVIKKQFESTLK